MISVSNSDPRKPAAAQTWREKLRWLSEREWLRILFLAICGVAARLPALGGQLIWDDDYLVHGNPFIKSPLLILETFRHYLFPDAFSPHYRPVQNISYCFDYFLWNGEAYGYHISNLFWHVASGVLLYLLLRRLIRMLKNGRCWGTLDPRLGSAAAFFVALLWLVHPVHSAAVDYISGRADSLAAFFSCGAWLVYLQAGVVRKIRSRVLLYALAAFAGLLALGSRESACIWVMIFLLHLFTLERGATVRTKCLILAGVLCLVAAYAGLRQLPHTQLNAGSDGGSAPPVRLALMFRALGDYGRLMVFPANLHMERSVEAPEANLGNEGWRHAISSEYLSIVGLCIAAALCYGALRPGRLRALRAFGAGWFVVAFLPISNLITLNATVAEHWLYLPSIGFLLFVAGCVLELPIPIRQYAPAVALVALLALGARSIVRSSDWMSPETFYRHSLAAGAAKPRMALNLGLILVAKGEYEKAETLLRRVVKIYPDYPIASNALAHALFRQSKLDEARVYFMAANEAAERTRQEYPRTWIAALNIAHMHYREHDLPATLAVMEKARADYPGTWELISYEAEVLRELKGPAAALPIVQQFAQDNWWHAEAAIALGKLYSELGRNAEAETSYRHASRLDIHDVEALNLVALLNVRSNRLEEAWKTQRQALVRQPEQPRQYLLLSDILQRMGRTADAQAALAQVTRLQAAVRAETAAN
jgi:protein O-mannosyl-transferase